MTQHWAMAYIGKPWCAGAAGPDAYSCWGLVRAVMRERYGVELPASQVDENDLRACIEAIRGSSEAALWEPVPVGEPPHDGDGVELSHSTRPHHVGVWIDAEPEPGVLHSLEGSGVVFTTLSALRRNHWRTISFHRRRAA